MLNFSILSDSPGVIKHHWAAIECQIAGVNLCALGRDLLAWMPPISLSEFLKTANARFGALFEVSDDGAYLLRSATTYPII